MTKYTVTARYMGRMEEYEGGNELGEAREIARGFLARCPSGPVKICTVNKDCRLSVVEVLRGDYDFAPMA